MKKIIVLTALAALAAGASAQEMGRVLSATPITEQVAIPRQVCSNDAVYTEQQPSGAGALLGAIAGGAVGNAVGHGGGRAAATALGLIGGAVLGNNVEGTRGGYQNVQRCYSQNYYENRAVGYNVVYEYAGRQYSTRTQNDPGAWIPLNVQPAVQGMTSYPQGGYEQPGVVVTTRPGPVAYIVPPPATVIDYRDGYGRPYHPDPYWR